MATRISPTVLRLRLGAELRRLRQGRALTCLQVADQLRETAPGTNWSETKVSRVEIGKLSVHPGDITEMLRFYDVDPERSETLMTIARQARQRGWWHIYGDALPEWFTIFIDIETEASIIRAYRPEIVPGLLQTQAYARAVLTATVDTLSESELERRVNARVARQQILTQDRSLRYSAILDESALRRSVGGHGILQQQLEHLGKIAQLPNVTIRVMPFSAGEFVGAGLGGFVILEFEDVSLPQVVYVDYLTGALYLDKEKETRVYMSAFEHLGTIALSKQDSTEYILSLAEQT